MDISRLTDDELWSGLKDLSRRERGLAADAVAYVAEIERRGLHRERGWASMFEYCVRSLGWSEGTAFRRTRAARAVRAFPVILEMLYDGRLPVEGVVILQAFVEDEDFPSLLLRAVGKTAREIERLVADRRRDFPLRDSMRFVGVAPPPAAPSVPAPEPELLASGGDASRPGSISEVLPPGETASPPAPRLVRIGFTADEALHRMVLHAQRLMRHKYPDGRLEGIFRDALKLLIEKKDLGVRAALAAGRRARRARRAAEKTRSDGDIPP